MLRWMDGFEQYGTLARMTEGVGGGAAWSDVADWTLETSNPATGTYHLRMDDHGSFTRSVRRIFGAASQIVGFGYRFAISDLPSSENNGAVVLAEFRDVSNDVHTCVILGTDGSVFAVRGPNFFAGSSLGGTLLGTRSAPCIAAGGYHHFECKIKIANSGGYIEVRINEVTVLNITGVDTQNTANATAAQVVVGKRGDDPAGFSTFDMDDVFAWDDDASDLENTVIDFVGDKGCYYLRPNADTAEADWIESTGTTSYSLIDEVPPSGSDYLSDSTGAARTVVDVESLPGNVSEVIAMMPVVYARKEEAGTVTLHGGLVVGSEEAIGPDDSPSTAYAYLRPAPKTVDPDTGVAWANNAEPKLLIERTV